MAEIAIEGMEFFSYHGHFVEESVIGTRFVIDLYFHTDTGKAEISDNLNDTVNYMAVYQVVKAEMNKSSFLLEHVARRIIKAVKLNFPQIESIKIKLRKMNPPLGGQIGSVSVSLDD